MDELKKTFRPEFLNRIDDVIIFHRLPEESLSQELDDAAKAWLVKNGYDEAYGARPLKRLIQKEVENVLARQVLGSEFSPGDTVRVSPSESGETLVFERIAGEAPTPVEAT